MGRHLLVMALACIVAVAAAGCGGDGADPFPTALPTAESIDPDVLSQAVLSDADLPDGYTTETSIGSPGSVGVLASSTSRNGGVEIQISVIWMPTTIDAEASLARQRSVWIAFGWQEANDELPGTQAAFRYTKPGLPGFVELSINEQFVVSVQMIPSDQRDPDPAAGDEAEFTRLNVLIADRVTAIQADSLTPAARGVVRGAT